MHEFQTDGQNSSVVIGRSMEYALPVNWDLVVVPRGTAGSSVGPDGQGVQWVGEYGYAGIGLGETTAFGITIPAQNGLQDAVNEAGVYVGELYLPGFTAYASTEGVAAEKLLAPMDAGSYVLATSGSVTEAIEQLKKVLVWAQVIEPIGVVPLHLVIHDRSGASAVIEWIDGEMTVNDSPLGVATNAPPFPWHITNLSNFVNLSVLDVEPIKLEGQKLAAIGAGSGWLGLPGDYTPPSRFVRAVALSGTAYDDADSAGAARTALHILGSFDIPKGTIRDRAPEGVTAAQAAGLGDFTSFVSVSELGETPAYGYRTYDDMTPRRFELAEGR